jgi:hypothetical protein
MARKEFWYWSLKMINYSKIARALMTIQYMPLGALPYFPSARLAPIQRMYRHFLKETGWIVEAAIRKENQIVIILCNTRSGVVEEIILEPKDE